MKGCARVAVIFLTLAALVVGFAGGTVALDVFQPTNSSANVMVQFEVKDGDTTASVAQRLQDDGLIRNALLFRAWARYRKLDRGIEQGVYALSPQWTMDHIMQTLQTGKPTQIVVRIPEGQRATQYPAYFTGLNGFNADQFNAAAKTGVLSDGTKLWTKYWFIQQPGKNVSYALDGYLYPATYYFLSSANTTDVVTRLLNTFGEQLCPGPDNQPDAYLNDAKQCRAHAVNINGKNIFDLMRTAYPDANDDVTALHDAMIISSITAREIKKISDAPGVAGVYHNRYLHLIGKLASDTGNLGADPTVQYARDNENPPANDGKWWAPLSDSGNNIAKTNPYNTYTQAGLPPGPISNPYWPEMQAGISPPASTNFYFVSDKCGNTVYANNNAQFQTILPKMNSGSCG